jgi:hypothetical protein
VQVHTLYALLGLDADQGRLRREQPELALGDEAQVGAADGELRLDDLERPPVVGEGLGQDAFAIARRELGGERRFDLAERLQVAAA